MRATLLFSLAGLTAALNPPSPQHIFSNPEYNARSTYKIPTVHESAVQARRILRLENIGTLSTVFPNTHSTENRPSEVSGAPIGLMDYYADCEAESGNPTILAITIATSFKNEAAGSNITLSLRWHPRDGRKFYSAAAFPRYSLLGYLEDISPKEALSQNVIGCFVKNHPDAAAWLPGNRIHESKWVRLVVQEIYWIGGFGDRAYIGWIPQEEWQNVTKEEIDSITLPGEKAQGWGSWKTWLGLGAEEQDDVPWEL
ncbi:pyridoxamine 5'-phosphate oxidase-domain-containing protein [Lophiotrema nucula]|uniref:Pyridoxamine 5'-phosphate oxidase-domain-containing protein n=1 Tax=Lophiotrema nucula TaxID=690887 RepID=A0A6A5ZC17_9PLEO|nr:pyridoxamine 5'-phosphate oxidase-domain-containing protein [Lophiotrema nucula]